MGDFPLITDTGTFIINGAERVIVSQLVRSPGVYYGREIDPMGVRLYTSTVIPNRGAWIELETDANGVVYARIDRNRKIPATVLIRALGWASECLTSWNYSIMTNASAGHHLKRIRRNRRKKRL
jgi:DNA-directed RNA polymerase subunit beta